MAVQWRGDAVARQCSVVLSSCAGVDDRGVVSASDSGSAATNSSEAMGPPSFSSLALLFWLGVVRLWPLSGGGVDGRSKGARGEAFIGQASPWRATNGGEKAGDTCRAIRGSKLGIGAQRECAGSLAPPI